MKAEKSAAITILFCGLSFAQVDVYHLAAVKFTGYCSVTNTYAVDWGQTMSVAFQTDGKNVKGTPDGVLVEWQCPVLGQSVWKALTVYGGSYNGGWARNDMARPNTNCPCHSGGYYVTGGYDYSSQSVPLFSLLGVSLNTANARKPAQVDIRVTVTRNVADGNCGATMIATGRILLAYPSLAEDLRISVER